MTEPKDMVVRVLRELRDEMRTGFQEVAARLDAIEATQKQFKSALTADTLLSKLVTGDFELRFEQLEKSVAEIMSAGSPTR